jgi:hypothetical protein
MHNSSSRGKESLAAWWRWLVILIWVEESPHHVTIGRDNFSTQLVLRRGCRHMIRERSPHLGLVLLKENFRTNVSGHLLDRPKSCLLLGLHALTEPPAHNVCGRLFFISGRRPSKVKVKALLCSSKLLLWRAVAECVFLILYPHLIFVGCMRCQKGFSAALLLKGQSFHVR